MPGQTDQTSTDASFTPTTVNGTSKPQKKKDAPDKGTSSLAIGEKSIASPGEQKLSGAELKKQKAAEKAARRKEKVAERVEPAQVVQTQTQTHNQPQTPQLQRRQSTGKKDNAPVTQHKRTGSSSGKALPLRGTAAVVPPESDKKLKDEKRVAFFSHLYPKEKRTNIAGAGKEIHPAVLALGLQLRDHIICGGSARCVATLLVFKKVLKHHLMRDLVLTLIHLLGHTSLYYPSWCRSLPSSHHPSLSPNQPSQPLATFVHQPGKLNPLAQEAHLYTRRQPLGQRRNILALLFNRWLHTREDYTR